MINLIGVFKSASTVILSLLLVTLPCVVSADDESLPFFAFIKGNLDLKQTGDPCILTNEDTGNGFATHMGRITATTNESLNFCSVAPNIAVNGDVVLKNDNGDSLSCTYENIATPVPGSTEVTSTGNFQCESGAGRLGYCSGEGAIAARGSLSTLKVDLVFLGKLNCL